MRGPGRPASVAPTWPPRSPPTLLRSSPRTAARPPDAEPEVHLTLLRVTLFMLVHHDREERRKRPRRRLLGVRRNPTRLTSNGSTVGLPFVMPEYPSRTKPQDVVERRLRSAPAGGRQGSRSSSAAGEVPGPEGRLEREARPEVLDDLVVRADAQRPPQWSPGPQVAYANQSTTQRCMACTCTFESVPSTGSAEEAGTAGPARPAWCRRWSRPARRRRTRPRRPVTCSRPRPLPIAAASCSGSSCWTRSSVAAGSSGGPAASTLATSVSV